jgi:hypothetical protein
MSIQCQEYSAALGSESFVCHKNVHVDVNTLARNNREWLRLGPDALARAVLHIENVRTGWQRNTIVPAFVWSYARDLPFPVLTFDN